VGFEIGLSFLNVKFIKLLNQACWFFCFLSWDLH
jgi:hypothetical protein